jgi:hypothetical protein
MRVLFGWVAPALAVALGAGSPRAAAPAADTFPPAVASYESAGRAAGAMIARPSGGEAFALDPDFSFLEAEEAGPQSYWPVLYSALVPGLGELTMGYEKRGIALMVIEVAAWTGYFTYHSDGLDKRDAYEAFADAHWDFDKWIDDHPASCVPPNATLEDVEKCGKDSSGSGDWPGWIPWVPREEDKQHYYENIGKYDWYISGWKDWDAALIPYAYQTDLRTEYRAMRGESNDALDTANSFVWVSLAARVFSIAETAIIVHGQRDAMGAGTTAPVSLRARPRGYSGGEVALEVRFK